MSRKRLITIILIALLAGALVALWSAREPIARNFVDRTLAAEGVPARYRITYFGFRSQRLEDVVIGDPARPDLVARQIDLRFGWSGIAPAVRMISAQGVRLRGRVVDGQLSLGTIDRLLPKPSGEPFALPDIVLSLRDTRMRLETPAGVIGIAMSGSGNVANDFQGKMAAIAHRLEFGGCVLDRPTAFVNIATVSRQPAFDGPVRMRGLRCGDAQLQRPEAAVDIALGEAIDTWSGGARMTSGTLTLGGHRIESLRGRLSFKGTSAATDARLRLALAGIRVKGLRESLGGMAGTPAAPFAAQLLKASDEAARLVDADAAIHIAGSELRIAPVRLTSASGAHVEIEGSGSEGLWIGRSGQRLSGRLSMAGGGLPDAVVHIQNRAGTLHMAPWAVPGGRLAVEDVRFDQDRVSGKLWFDGPVGDGRITGLALALDARRARARWIVNPGCRPIGFGALELAGMRLGATRLPLCAGAGGLLDGGTIHNPRLTGTVGDSPLTMTARRLGFTVSRPGFAIDALAVRLGENRLDMARLTGESASAGRFIGASGKIGPVPLLLTGGAGRWRFGDGTLRLDGRLDVDDADPAPRFERLASDDVALILKDGQISASGSLKRPGNAQTIAIVHILHDLGRTTGHALLDVPGIRFSPDFQPEYLTRLTLGVVANVDGMVSGQGRIFWNESGVRSDGDFRTERVDLAAAFGPVSRLSGRVHFSDLIGMETPPGQEVLIGEVNPGVAVTDGVVRYQLLPDQMVRIESGRWPFSGGQLLLAPTTLDFGRPSARYLTFKVDGMDAALFVEQFEFKNIAVTGVFDGNLPMVFDADGGRIEKGRLEVREAGGSVAYVGPLSNEKLGRFAGMAFDALKSIRYENLAIELDGSLDGEIVSRVVFTGTNDAPVGEKRGLVKQLTGLPFRFNIKITAPFRWLINSAQSINDPRALVQDAIARQRAATPVQPQESEKLP